MPVRYNGRDKNTNGPITGLWMCAISSGSAVPNPQFEACSTMDFFNERKKNSKERDDVEGSKTLKRP